MCDGVSRPRHIVRITRAGRLLRCDPEQVCPCSQREVDNQERVGEHMSWTFSCMTTDALLVDFENIADEAPGTEDLEEGDVGHYNRADDRSWQGLSPRPLEERPELPVPDGKRRRTHSRKVGASQGDTNDNEGNIAASRIEEQKFDEKTRM